MSINLSQRAQCATELSAAMTGSTISIGTLLFVPAIMIFDNQGTVPIQVFYNQTTNVWRTFPGGEALVLDLRAAHGMAANFSFSIGDTFFGNGASGTFSISYIYALSV